TIHLSRRDRRQYRMRPDETLAPESTADVPGYDPNILARNAERIGHYVACPRDPLRGFVQGELVAFPHRGRSGWLHRIMVLDRRRICVADLHRSCLETRGGIATLVAGFREIVRRQEVFR